MNPNDERRRRLGWLMAGLCQSASSALAISRPVQMQLLSRNNTCVMPSKNVWPFVPSDALPGS